LINKPLNFLVVQRTELKSNFDAQIIQLEEEKFTILNKGIKLGEE